LKRRGITDHLYSDDIQLYTTFTLDPDYIDQKRAFSSITACVGETKQWMTDNPIKFNESKTDALVVHSKSSRCKPAALPLIFGESSILPSDSVRNLGCCVILDKHLTMQEQIGNICRTSFYQLRRIAKIRKFLHGLLLPNLFLPSFSHTSTMAILFWLVFQQRGCIHYRRLRTLRLASSRVLVDVTQ
jgi:hypothetical protein